MCKKSFLQQVHLSPLHKMSERVRGMKRETNECDFKELEHTHENENGH
jgi:hypothetical protein